MKKLAKFARKSLSRLYDRPLAPPTKNEEHLIGELREAFRNLRNIEAGGESAGHEVWIDIVNQLRGLVLTSDPREFLRWPVVTGTMVAQYHNYLSPEFTFLKKRRDWSTRWSQAVKECSIGHPVPYWRYPASSGTLIHHAYHLARFEEKTAVRVDSLNFVLEFGGGYGSMCRLFHSCGFDGKYVIFDLPALSALQRFFLKSIPIEVHTVKSFNQAEKGVLCISDLQNLRSVLASCLNSQNNMFIATWSISETPVKVRNCILQLLPPFGAFLISYQDQFMGIDNAAFFHNWKLTQQAIKWFDWEIQHMPKNRYLIGVRG